VRCDRNATSCDRDAFGLRCRDVTVDAMSTEPHLLTGWERDLDASDTLLRRYLFHHAALGAAFTLAGGGRALEADDVSMADLGRPCGYFNGAVLLRPPSDWDAVMARVERFFAGGRGQACLWSAWPTPDLRHRGWSLSGHPPLLIRPPLSTNPVKACAATTVDVRPVTSEVDLAHWERTAIDGYPLSELCDAPVGSLAPHGLLDDERLHFVAGWDGSRLVAAGVSFVSHGIASFAYGATLPSARRRGFWRELAHARLRATPQLWTTGVFSDFSRPGAEQIGFVPLQRLTLWTLDRS
jgi:hypothetical protein